MRISMTTSLKLVKYSLYALIIVLILFITHLAAWHIGFELGERSGLAESILHQGILKHNDVEV